ncbi:hypothetical protein PVK06_014755 [Gossypium arboreum]|uniref:Phospholipase/carboxylesterase/thioesterase domain-containing protein n=1 Tax=Gossypium arboreum TaxID=29729 RepID=A0ABR0PVJ8_GOSAR|nr:hypothetical protein PVK06_014755 [Gossypium arboreum]
MSYSYQTVGSGSGTARKTFDFGRTHVVRPKGKHQATIVWLHGLGDNGSSWSQILESLPLPNIKWICPTAPTRPVAILGGFPCTAWFDAGELSEDGPDDWEGLDASAAHIANFLSTEPSDVKVGIGGFSMGAAMALYSATAYALGRYGNGNPYPISLRAVVGLSGWLPGSRYGILRDYFSKEVICKLFHVMFSTSLTCKHEISYLLGRGLRNKIEVSSEAARRAASLPILLSHGTCDDVVPYKNGEKCAQSLSIAGFRNLTFKTYEGIGHYTVPKEMDEVCNWLTARLGLEGSR